MKLDSPEQREQSALRHIKQVDPLLYAKALPYKGSISSRVQPKRTNAALFEALVSSIVSQQLSTKAAQSIFTRLKTVLGGSVAPTKVLETTTFALRSAGLSTSKVRSITELAEAIQTKKLNLLKLSTLPAPEAVTQLTAVHGIGPWTAEMFLIFALGAPDVFSPGDLILDRQMREALALPASMSKKELATLAERWSPHRSFISLLFWKLHHVQKDAEQAAKESALKTKGTK
jgi:DNA-3-methyladenine glycosylase II